MREPLYANNNYIVFRNPEGTVEGRNNYHVTNRDGVVEAATASLPGALAVAEEMDLYLEDKLHLRIKDMYRRSAAPMTDLATAFAMMEKEGQEVN